MNMSLTGSARTRLLGRVAALLVLALAVGGASAGCSAERHEAAPSASATHGAASPSPAGEAPSHGSPPAPNDPMVPSAEQVASALAVRPAYVTASPAKTQAAYAYALARPDVLKWLPCYCGCGGMGHRSNLDCFVKPRDEAGDPLLFEEHASYCDICVETALLADQMLREGRTLIQIRAAVDATFAGSVPGTVTELPPSG